MPLDPVVVGKVSGGLITAWLAGYGGGMAFRYLQSWIEKAVR